jgi:hypothetical protein
LMRVGSHTHNKPQSAQRQLKPQIPPASVRFQIFSRPHRDRLICHYSYALSSSTKLTFDYQFIANPGYNTDREPANIFAGRFHTQFFRFMGRFQFLRIG